MYEQNGGVTRQEGNVGACGVGDTYGPEGDVGVVGSWNCQLLNTENGLMWPEVMKCGRRKEAVNSLHQSVRIYVTETCFNAASSRESAICETVYCVTM